jgi:catechol 2,3-dioxygenase-like lactoylglutathione lyase family enzyme
LVEQHPRNVQVVGSIPIVGSYFISYTNNEHSFHKETCLYVKDLERTREFYTNKLGLPLISFVKNRHVFFRAGRSVLLCFIADETKKEMGLPSHGAEGSIHFAFEVSRDEYTNSLEQVKEAGIKILHEHSWKSQLRSFYFHDPDGHLIEVIEQGIWER